MFKKILSKTKYSEEELLKELLNTSFDKEKATKIYDKLDINLNNIFFNEEPILHYCCKKDLYQSVLWLLENKADPELENEQNETAIFYAIHSKSSAIINLLIENKVNVDHLNIYRRTALQDAVISANNRIVDVLINVTSKLSNCDIHGNNLIFDAVSNGNLEIIKKIAFLKDVNINQINEEGNTILHKEIVLKNNSLALLLLELGADPTILDRNGKNFLFYAITKGIGNLTIIQKAVDLGCDINSKSSQNTTLLMESVNYYINAKDEKEKFNHLEMIKELLKLNINVDISNNFSENAFFMATKSESRELINIFFENSIINLNKETNLGETPLLILVLNGIKNNDLIRLYLEKGADPTRKNKSGKSIIEILIDIILHIQNKKDLDFELHLNEDAEYPTVLENLLRNCQIDLNDLNSNGEPLFFQSILYFNFKLFKILKIKNININQKDKDGNNIIFKLMEFNHKNLIKDRKLYLNTLKSLVNSGVDINAKNNEGLTPLQVAITEDCEYTIRLLLELRADCFITDNKGRSIIHNCILKNNTKYFKLIHHFNKDISNLPDSFGVRPINYAAFMGKKDLLVEMLDNGVLINNPIKKDPKILKFFEKFHPNIINLTNGVEKKVDKANIQLLKENMIKEFDIKL